ncbi:spore germination protein [Paenibacillus arenilitoris]|uniref:Spore germination protein n=1 Tax=Paenibacillus arenilitoris TaxID=2772299 RepID=A0A927CJ01_9BACL|nr:spore germination protein [Paenibacillus arenilitoris]MBD2868350.1 spore germination protein [Paenibacillus arenilitoris]
MVGRYKRGVGRAGKKTAKQSARAEKHEQQQLEPYADRPLFAELKQNRQFIAQQMGESADVIFREMQLMNSIRTNVLVVYVQGMVDDERMNEFVLQPLHRERFAQAAEARPDELPGMFKNHVLSTGIVNEIKDWKQFFEKLLLGYCLILFEGTSKAISSSVVGGERRGIEEPKTEMAIRGPREGFTESIRVNTAMIRRKIRSPKLWLEQKTIGELTQTPVCIMYIQGLADENVLKDLRERLDAIKIDGVLESGYIEELIEEQMWTPFPTVMNIERPDAVAGNLLEGRIAILVDGTPFVLIVPTIMNMFFQSSEDYYQRYDIATFLRMLRFVSFLIALLMPSVYVAIVSYHQEMIPTQLLLKLAAQREGVPFPAYLEAFIMELVFEILREAVIRMPSAAGNTISIVGGLVIGQSVVEAGIVSPAVVIVVSFTAIASFVSPAYSLGIAARLLRFLLLLAASTLGFYGIGLVVLLLLLHLSNIRSFGIPYTKPFAPLYFKDLKDTLVRAPLWLMRERPQKLAVNNPVREQIELEPRKEPGQ